MPARSPLNLMKVSTLTSVVGGTGSGEKMAGHKLGCLSDDLYRWVRERLRILQVDEMHARSLVSYFLMDIKDLEDEQQLATSASKKSHYRSQQLLSLDKLQKYAAENYICQHLPADNPELRVLATSFVEELALKLKVIFQRSEYVAPLHMQISVSLLANQNSDIDADTPRDRYNKAFPALSEGSSPSQMSPSIDESNVWHRKPLTSTLAGETFQKNKSYSSSESSPNDRPSRKHHKTSGKGKENEESPRQEHVKKNGPSVKHHHHQRMRKEFHLDAANQSSGKHSSFIESIHAFSSNSYAQRIENHLKSILFSEKPNYGTYQQAGHDGLTCFFHQLSRSDVEEARPFDFIDRSPTLDSNYEQTELDEMDKLLALVCTFPDTSFYDVDMSQSRLNLYQKPACEDTSVGFKAFTSEYNTCPSKTKENIPECQFKSLQNERNSIFDQANLDGTIINDKSCGEVFAVCSEPPQTLYQECTIECEEIASSEAPLPPHMFLEQCSLNEPINQQNPVNSFAELREGTEGTAASLYFHFLPSWWASTDASDLNDIHAQLAADKKSMPGIYSALYLSLDPKDLHLEQPGTDSQTELDTAECPRLSRNMSVHLPFPDWQSVVHKVTSRSKSADIWKNLLAKGWGHTFHSSSAPPANGSLMKQSAQPTDDAAADFDHQIHSETLHDDWIPSNKSVLLHAGNAGDVQDCPLSCGNGLCMGQFDQSCHFCLLAEDNTDLHVAGTADYNHQLFSGKLSDCSISNQQLQTDDHFSLYFWTDAISKAWEANSEVCQVSQLNPELCMHSEEMQHPGETVLGQRIQSCIPMLNVIQDMKPFVKPTEESNLDNLVETLGGNGGAGFVLNQAEAMDNLHKLTEGVCKEENSLQAENVDSTFDEVMKDVDDGVRQMAKLDQDASTFDELIKDVEKRVQELKKEELKSVQNSPRILQYKELGEMTVNVNITDGLQPVEEYWSSDTSANATPVTSRMLPFLCKTFCDIDRSEIRSSFELCRSASFPSIPSSQSAFRSVRRRSSFPTSHPTSVSFSSPEIKTFCPQIKSDDDALPVDAYFLPLCDDKKMMIETVELLEPEIKDIFGNCPPYSSRYFSELDEEEDWTDALPYQHRADRKLQSDEGLSIFEKVLYPRPYLPAVHEHLIDYSDLDQFSESESLDEEQEEEAKEVLSDKKWKDLMDVSEEEYQVQAAPRRPAHVGSRFWHDNLKSLEQSATAEYLTQTLDCTFALPVPQQALYVADVEKELLRIFEPRRRAKARAARGPVHINKPCSFFLEGKCYRADCKYTHDMSTITCRFWLEDLCFKGDHCPFLHGYPSDGTGDHSSKRCRQTEGTFDLKKEDFPELSSKKQDQHEQNAPPHKKKKNVKKHLVRHLIPRGID